MMRGLVGVLVLIIGAFAIPTQKLTLDSMDEMVGMTKFEAKLMSLARMGKYEVFLSIQDIYTMLSDVHPFTKYEEAKENVVLMDEFPYVPVIDVAQFNSSFVLSNLVLKEDFDPRYLKVELNTGFQSLNFLDMSLNATFDWRLNNTNQVGHAVVHVPHAWVHQNFEVGCTRDQASILSWEGRVDLYVDGIEISTTSENKALMDAFASEMHESLILKKYLGNALQHQLASFMGDLHWKLQGRMRDLCLVCVVVKNNNQTMVAQLRGDKQCLNSIPSFFWKGVYDETETPQDLQSVAGEALHQALLREYKPHKDSSDLLEMQDLASVNASVIPAHFDQLVPRVDPRDKYRHKSHPGFVEETAAIPGWKQKLGQMWMRFRYGEQASNSTQTA